MTYMTEAPRPESQIAPSHDGYAGGFPAAAIHLKNMAGRHVDFKGEELGMAMSYTPDLPYWFEINIFRATDGTFPVAIKQFFQSSEKRDLARAWVARSIDEAFKIVEEFDPAHDVPVSTWLMAQEMSAAEMEAIAMDLQAQVQQARTHYRSLVGELLHALDS